MFFKEIKLFLIVILLGFIYSCGEQNYKIENKTKCINVENMIGKIIVFTFYVRQVYYNDLYIDFVNEKHGNYNSFLVETVEPADLLGNVYHINFQGEPLYNGKSIIVGEKFQFTHKVLDCNSNLGMFL